jgi:hypothetical protein
VSDHTIALLGLLISVVGAVVAAAVALWRFHGKRREPAVAERRMRLAEQAADAGLVERALVAYYDPDSLAAGRLSLYRVRIAGDLISVAYATRPEWLELNVPLDRDRCTLEQRNPWRAVGAMAAVRSSHVARLRELLHAAEPKMWDDPLYRLVHVDAQPGRLEARFAVDSFMNYRLNSGLVMEEVADAVIACELDVGRLVRDRARRLPIREALMGDGRALVDFGERMTQGGVCVMLAMAHPGGHYLVPIAQRTRKVAGNQGMLSLIPEGLHAPLDTFDGDVSLSDSVYRELFEELFQGENVASGGARLTPRWYLEHSPALQWLAAHPTSVTAEFLCVGTSLVNGSYEVGVLLAVHDPAFWTEFEATIEANWEASTRYLLSTLDQDQIASLLRRPNWTPEGRVHLIEGLRRLAQLAPDAVALPPIERVSPVVAEPEAVGAYGAFCRVP